MKITNLMKTTLQLIFICLGISISTAQSVTTDTALSLDDVLASITTNLECTSITNVTSTNNAQINAQGFNSYGSFQIQNEPNFPFENGIVLSTADASDLQDIISPGNSQWPGDADLEALIQEPGNTYNATVIEFDFVPFRTQLSVDYVLASQEYPSFICNFADTFAFIVSGGNIPNVNSYDHDANPNTPEVSLDLGGLNIATLPGTTIPVNPTNVHNIASSCAAGSLGEFALPQFFDDLSSNNNILDFGGQTIPLTAEVDLVPGQTYHIKLVIADRGDNILDSSVFIDADSFVIGTIPEDLPYQPGLPVDLPECWNTTDSASYDVNNTCSDTSENYLQMFGGNYSIETAAVDTDGLTGVDISWDILNGCNDTAEAGKNLIVEYFDGSDWQLLADIDPINIPVANSSSSDNWMTVSYTVTSGMSKNFILRFSRQNGDNLLDDISIANLSITESTLSNQEFSADTFKIYPNPTSDFIFFESQNSTPIQSVEIFDINGKLIHSIELSSSDDSKINIESLNSGLYFAKIKSENQYFTKRFIKQ